MSLFCVPIPEHSTMYFMYFLPHKYVLSLPHIGNMYIETLTSPNEGNNSKLNHAQKLSE
jgi:hypothetical protein